MHIPSVSNDVIRATTEETPPGVCGSRQRDAPARRSPQQRRGTSPPHSADDDLLAVAQRHERIDACLRIAQPSILTLRRSSARVTDSRGPAQLAGGASAARRSGTSSGAACAPPPTAAAAPPAEACSARASAAPRPALRLGVPAPVVERAQPRCSQAHAASSSSSTVTVGDADVLPLNLVGGHRRSIRGCGRSRSRARW
jgi:hypothetical protein